MPQAVNFCGPPSPSAVSRVPALTKRLDLAMCRASGVSASSDGTDDLRQNSLLFVQFHSFHIMIFNDVSLTSHLHLWQNCTTPQCVPFISFLVCFPNHRLPKTSPSIPTGISHPTSHHLRDDLRLPPIRAWIPLNSWDFGCEFRVKFPPNEVKQKITSVFF